MGKINRSSSKKRPNNLTFGRFYNHAILDIFEARVTSIEGNLEEAFKNIGLTQRPVLLVFGDIFETNPNLERIRNYFTDLFGSNNQKKKIDIDYSLGFVITLTGYEDLTLDLGFYKYSKQTNTLEDLKVRLSLKVGRTQIASQDLFSEACKQPKTEKKTSLKKVLERTGTNEKMARIHVRQQDLKTLRIKKIKKRVSRKSNNEAQE